MDRGTTMTERTKPYPFLLEGLTVHIGKEETTWVAELRWDADDGCFVLQSDGPGNFDFAPCDLEELARILRGLRRELTPP